MLKTVQERRETRRIGAIAFEASDPRADGQRRKVSIDSTRVTIARRLFGMRMQVVVPCASYRGIVLEPKPSGASERFVLWLDHRDPDLCVPLVEGANAADLMAQWMGWAQFFSLPPLLESSSAASAGSNERSFRALKMGGASERRFGRSVGARRPRFLARRQTGGPTGAH